MAMAIDQIRTALADRRLKTVSAATGISYGTLLNIRDNPDCNPQFKTVEALEKYLNRKVTK